MGHKILNQAVEFASFHIILQNLAVASHYSYFLNKSASTQSFPIKLSVLMLNQPTDSAISRTPLQHKNILLMKSNE